MYQESKVKYQYILFDLDGTLSDPREGITKSVQYALKDQGIIEDDLEKLTIFIGPPLLESFQLYYGMNEQEARQAVVKYRERFSKVGIFENEIFNDTKDVLASLKKYGYHLALATSKPEEYARRIIDHFGITDDFEVIKGAIGERNDKGDVISDALALFGNPSQELCLMVGDRKHDIIGAKENKIDVAALKVGFAPEGEFEEYQPTYILEDLTELKEFLL